MENLTTPDTLNGVHEAIRVGYCKKTAKQIGSKLLTKVDLQEYLIECMKARSKRTKVDSDYVLTRLVDVDKMDVIDI